MQMHFRMYRRPIASMLAVLTVAVLLVFLTGSLPGFSVTAQDKTLVWERFDVDIAVNADSSFDVVEHQAIRFTRGSFTFG